MNRTLKKEVKRLLRLAYSQKHDRMKERPVIWLHLNFVPAEATVIWNLSLLTLAPLLSLVVFLCLSTLLLDMNNLIDFWTFVSCIIGGGIFASRKLCKYIKRNKPLIRQTYNTWQEGGLYSPSERHTLRLLEEADLGKIHEATTDGKKLDTLGMIISNKFLASAKSIVDREGRRISEVAAAQRNHNLETNKLRKKLEKSFWIIKDAYSILMWVTFAQLMICAKGEDDRPASPRKETAKITLPTEEPLAGKS